MKTISVKTYRKLTALGLKADTYTLDEILDMLPKSIKFHYFIRRKDKEFATYLLNIDYCIYEYKWLCHICLRDDADILIEFAHENPAESAGKLLIWCIKNGHVKVEDLNNENNQC